MTHLDVPDTWQNSVERVGTTPRNIRDSFLEHLRFSLAKHPVSATEHDLYTCLALAVRDRVVDRWIETQRIYYRNDVKRVYYLSLEVLPGRALLHNLLNLGLLESARQALSEVGVDLIDLLEQEPDAGLGNGGLGRLAACFMDSMATLGIPATSYGIRYEYGIFEQEIREGRQVEHPDEWLRHGNPWEIERPEYEIPVHFGGRVVHRVHEGRFVADWIETTTVLGVPYDTPVVGYGARSVNTMRLWRARASKEFDLQLFNHGDYVRAVAEKNASENISRVLYPNDELRKGKELRLRQEYFFVACSLYDIVRRYLVAHDSFDAFPDKVAIQLNDTHPALAIPELMRLFVDVHGLGWEEAWDLVERSVGFTNHTLLPEALERWPESLMATLLPRHLELIREIDRRFLRQVMFRFPMDEERLRRMAIISEGPDRQVRMAHLAVVGSHSVNGVAELHTRLLEQGLFKDFYEMWPHRFNAKTNGVTQRRWLLQSNPRLAALLTERLGEGWITDLDQLRQLVPLADDADLQEEMLAIKAANKRDFAAFAAQAFGIDLDPESIFDIQIKRIHEYKRQLLNALHVADLYRRIKEGEIGEIFPHTFLFGGKSAPGYRMAKLIIEFINAVADVVNRDPDTSGQMRVFFVPNYRVSLAERLFPAADVSEQISTAGMEASGTGNMKFALNGAITLGTLDGANIEILEEVGEENFFRFGHTVEEIDGLRRSGYDPRALVARSPGLARTLELIRGGFFSPDAPDRFWPLLQALIDGGDRFFVLADFASYAETQAAVAAAYLDRPRWARMMTINIGSSGRFSSDRTIRQYCQEIWSVEPCGAPRRALTDRNET